MDKRMAQVLAAVTEIEAEHRVFRQDLGTKVQSLSEMEALVSLERLQTSLAASSRERLAESQKATETIVQSVDGALRTHFIKEENTLLPVLSKTLSQALVIEHQKIGKTLDDLMAAMTVLEKTSGDFPRTLTRFQALVRQLDTFLTEHMAKEDSILRLVRKALEIHGG